MRYNFLFFLLSLILCIPCRAQIDLTDGLIAYYPLNGNANDDSGNDHVGTIHGALPTVDRFGNIGQAMDFDGIDDYVEIPNHPDFNNNDSLSIVLWAKWCAESYGWFISKGKDFEYQYGVMAEDEFIRTTIWQSAGGDYLSPGKEGYKDGTWHSIVVTVVNGIDSKLYVDGVLVNIDDTPNGTWLQNGTSPVHLGKLISDNGANDQFCEASIDDVRLYNRVLNEDEIEALYLENNYNSGILGLYSLNGHASDLSGNNHDGTIIGATATTDRFGNNEGALLFDGVDDEIRIPNPFGLIDTDADSFAFSIWFKSTSSKAEANIISYSTKCHNNGMGDDDFFAVSLLNGSTISVSNGNVAPIEFYINNLNDGQFHLLSMSYSGFEYSLFVDGALISNFNLPSSSAPIPDDYDLVLGYVHLNSCGDNSFFEGVMDDVRLYDRSISIEEVEEHFDGYHNIIVINKTTCNPVEVGMDTISYFDETCAYITEICHTALETFGPSQGLAAFYPLEGNALDMSGNALHGTISGAVPTEDRFGTANGALYFDGNDNIIVADHPLLKPANSLTVSVWAKPEIVHGNVSIVTKRINNTSPPYNSYYISPNNGFYNFTIETDMGQGDLESLAPYVLDEWSHIVGTYDGSHLSLWVNGVLQDRIPQSGNILYSDNTLRIAQAANGQHYQGDLSDVLIFDRALSDIEILNLYNSSSSDGLQAYYPLDGNANDYSGNNFHAQINGPAATTDRFGNPDSAFEFDGIDDYMDFGPTNRFSATSEFAVSFWVEFTDFANSDGVFFSNYNGGTFVDGDFHFNWRTWHDDKIGVHLGQNPAPKGLIYLSDTGVSSIFLENIPYLIAMSVDLTEGPNQKVRLWINENEIPMSASGNGPHGDGEGNGQPLLNIIESLEFGRFENGSRFKGIVDDIRIYNRAITASDVAQLYAQSAAPCEDCTAFTDLITPGEALDAATCLCESGAINPQYYDAMNSNGVNPTAHIYRADLAKLVYYSLYYGDNSSPADDYPVPFLDLQKNDVAYYRYAKALSYLDYGDGITPFNNHFANFNPYDSIQRRYALKVLLEAYNIAPDESELIGVDLGISVGEDGYGYMHKAYDLGLITTGNATDFMLRADMFVILYRLLNSCGGPCITSCMNPNPVDSNYIKPGNITPKNMGRNFGMAEGYFQNYTTTSFNIPGIKLPLEFSHLYNSYLTLLPDSLRSIQPLGEGWTHSYHAYIVKQSGWSQGAENFPDHWMVMWPNGAIHSYDCSEDTTLNYGVYDDFQVIDPNTIQIKKQSQIVFTFTRFTYPSGKEYYLLTRIADRNNNQINITYTNAITPRIDFVTGTAGRVLQFNYANGVTQHISSIQDVAGNRSILFHVNDDNNLESYTDPNGHTTTYNYTDPMDATTNAGDHLLYSITRPKGNNITNKYYKGDLISSQVGQSAPSTITLNKSYPQGISSTIFDGSGTAIHSSNGPHGYLINKNIHTTHMGFERDQKDPALITMIDYEGLQTHYTYDSEGRIDTISMPMGIEHSFTYTTLSDIKTYTDPKGSTTTYNYTNGNIDNISDNMGFVTDFTVNTKGQVLQIENPENITQSFTYDTHGNLTQIDAPLNITTRMAYDAIGRLDSIINPQQQVTKYEYDALGLVKKMIRRSGIDGDIMTMYDYDLNNNLRTITNALGGQTMMTYEDRDLLETMTFGDDTKMYAYRDDGLLETFEKPDGHIFVYEYDTLGRLETDGYAAYTYDSLDNIIKVMKDGQSIEMTYDAINRLDTVIYDGFTIIYEYDKNSNLTRLIYPEGFEVSYHYDPNNRLDSLTFNGQTIDYQYLKDGRIDQVILPTGGRREYDYDAAGRMTYMADVKSSNDTISRYFFKLDSLGNHVREDRLEPEGEPTLEELNILYGYNAENEIDFANDTTFTFDENGNQIGKNSATGVFDNKDMMTNYKGKTYTYDGLGLRRIIDDGNGVKKYIWDVRGMGYVLAETNTSDAIEYFYVYGQGLEARIRKSDMSISYYHSDFRGSTVAMTDASETITHSYSYLPYGELVASTETDPNPFKYVGRYGVMDEGGNLYYMRARYMDALTGRFLSEDPVWHENLFSYVGGNPIIYNDPSGKVRRTEETVKMTSPAVRSLSEYYNMIGDTKTGDILGTINIGVNYYIDRHKILELAEQGNVGGALTELGKTISVSAVPVAANGAGASNPVSFALVIVAPAVVDDVTLMVESGFDINELNENGSFIWQYSQEGGDLLEKGIDYVATKTGFKNWLQNKIKK